MLFRSGMNFMTFDAGGVFKGGINLIQDWVPTQNSITVHPGLAGVWPVGATHYALISGRNHDAASTGLANIHVVNATAACGGAALESGCCPPDPTIEAKLNAIFGLVKAIYEGLPSSPHSYAEATIHSALTGNGSIVLAATALAIKVDITADTTGFRISPGDPSYYWSRGYIVPITAEAPVRRPVRLVYNPQQYELPALTDSIGYTLPPGITIKITELVAGP